MKSQKRESKILHFGLKVKSGPKAAPLCCMSGCTDALMIEIARGIIAAMSDDNQHSGIAIIAVAYSDRTIRPLFTINGYDFSQGRVNPFVWCHFRCNSRRHSRNRKRHTRNRSGAEKRTARNVNTHYAALAVCGNALASTVKPFGVTRTCVEIHSVPSSFGPVVTLCSR